MTSKSPAGRIARILLFGVVLWSACGQEPDRQARQDSEKFLAEVDTLFSEIGGIATASLERGQRWRMVSSMGSGLPPPSFNLADLPESGSRGASLLEAYCTQCHWLPAPQMHAAQEWPILIRRMVMRAQTLHDRMGGPMTRGILGQYLLSGMASAQVPSAEDGDSLVAYLQRNALPVAQPGELDTDAETEFFVSRCGFCHETPSTLAHPAADWPAVVARMHTNMAMMGVRPLSDEEAKRVVSYLQERAPAARP
jgi:cytochrome c5